MWKSWRLGTKIGIVVAVVLLSKLHGTLVDLVQLRSFYRRFIETTEVLVPKRAEALRLRVAILESIRAEKNAVISNDDEESKRYQDLALKHNATAHEILNDLRKRIDTNGSAEEKRLLEEVARRCEQRQAIQREMLALAVQNSNVKAYQTNTTKMLDTVQAFQRTLQGLLRAIDQDLADPQNRDNPVKVASLQKKARYAEACQALMIDLHRHLDFHINAIEADMNRLEATLKQLDKELNASLTTLQATLEAKDRPVYDQAIAAYNTFKQGESEVLKLSRSNSNVRSSDLTLNKLNQLTTETLTPLTQLVEHLDQQLESAKVANQETYQTSWMTMLGAFAVGMVLAIVLALLLTRNIVRPIKQGVVVAEAIAKGDLCQRIRTDQADEVGRLCQSIDTVAESLAKVVRDIHQVSDALNGSSSELSSVSEQLQTMTQGMTQQVANVASATEQMSVNITTMAAAAEEMSMNVSSISSASEEISVNVGSISASAETASHNVAEVAHSVQQITTAFQEISQETREGSQIAGKAMDMASHATGTMGLLDRAAGEINKVTEMIKMIALQTNLLALNATIEATSAGEAGKGFAVVANEIKELANQSGKAAEDIAHKIEGVQQSTREAKNVIQQVATIIDSMNTSVGRIATSVDRQTTVANQISTNIAEASKGVQQIATAIAEVARGTNDMSRNIGEAAQGATDVSRNAGEAAKSARDIAANIAAVSQATNENAAGANRVNQAAKELAQVASQLQKLVVQFKLQG